MKRIFIAICFALFVGANAGAQSAYTRQGNNFTQQDKKKATAAVSAPTAYTYTTNDGKKYPIYLSKNGRAYINRISKKGNEYRQYLDEEISRQICKETGTIYTEKK